jgi:hypothetical protein
VAAREAGRGLFTEKETIANTIPISRRTRVLDAERTEMREVRCIRFVKNTREELLSHYIHFVLDNDLRINTGEEVIDVRT